MQIQIKITFLRYCQNKKIINHCLYKLLSISYWWEQRASCKSKQSK